MTSDIHTCKNPEIISTEKYSIVLHTEKTTLTVSGSAQLWHAFLNLQVVICYQHPVNFKLYAVPHFSMLYMR